MSRAETPGPSGFRGKRSVGLGHGDQSKPERPVRCLLPCRPRKMSGQTEREGGGGPASFGHWPNWACWELGMNTKGKQTWVRAWVLSLVPE